MAYWIAEPNQQAKGPFSIEQLRVLKFGPETLCWQPGMANWVQAEDIPELRTLFGPVAVPPPTPLASMPPPVQPPPPSRPPVSTAAVSPPAPSTFSTQDLRTIATWHRWLNIYFGITFLGGCLLYGGLQVISGATATQSVDAGQTTADLGGCFFYLFGSVALVVGAVVNYNLAAALKKTPWPYAIGAAIPFANLATLLILSADGRRTLQRAGVRMGFLGADPKTITGQVSSTGKPSSKLSLVHVVVIVLVLVVGSPCCITGFLFRNKVANWFNTNSETLNNAPPG